jgi:hypothetical protein
MDRRGFIAGGISAFFLALFPWLRPKPVLLPVISELELGWWQNYAMWNMVRGYDLRWQIGQHMNILDESLVRTGTTGGTRVTPAS